MNWKGSGRGLILRYYPPIRMVGLKRTTKTSIRVAGRQGRDLNPRPPKYEAGVNNVITNYAEVQKFLRPRSQNYFMLQITQIQMMAPNS
jgi:hypothetical protein